MKKLLPLIFLLAPILSQATTQTGTVKYVFARASDGLVIFELVGSSKTLVPGCGPEIYWVLHNEDSNAGKRQYAMLLTAQASGKVVNVAGLGTCTRQPGAAEDVDYIQIND